jgi:predicted phage terminase large subunit-like protein
LILTRPLIKSVKPLIPKDFNPHYYLDNVCPQPGPQTEFLATKADIAIYGGAAGGGKTYTLLLEPLRHIHNPKFGGVIFRETNKQIMQQGSLWDTSIEVYSKVKGAKAFVGGPSWTFEKGSSIDFRHLEDENQAMKDWQGAQPAYIAFDEVTHISRKLFFYIAFSRGRSLSGVRPYVRASCNPDATSWVKELLAPWITINWDGPGGPAKPGEIRYIRIINDDIVWYTKPVYSEDGMHRLLTKSMTFIPSNVYDNKVLLSVNPEYLTGLENLPEVEKQRLLYSNWDITESGNMFRKAWFEEVTEDDLPRYMWMVRFWDLAASEQKPGQKQPDMTCGFLEGHDPESGNYYLLDMVLITETPHVVEQEIVRTAAYDLTKWGAYGTVRIRMEQEPGSSGIIVTDHYKRVVLPKYDFAGVRSTGSKVERAKPLSAAAQRGLVKILKAPWNSVWFAYAGAFPRKDVKDDPVDGATGAHNALDAVEDDICPVLLSDRYAGVGR